VQNREEFRDLLDDVGKLPETQRSALLLREIDAMSYEEIASSMETTVPGVKSLLVRARIALAESTQARLLTCDEVRLELAEAAEGLAKAGGPVRRHVRECEGCKDFRDQLRTDTKALAALFPVPVLFGLKGLILGKLGLGSGGGAAAGGGAVATSGAAGGAAGGAAAGGVAATGGATAVGGVGAIGGAAAAGGAGAAGAAGVGGLSTAGALGLGAVGTKVGVGLTSAVLLAGAAEVKHEVDKTPNGQRTTPTKNSHTVAVTPPVAEPVPADAKAPTSADPTAPADPANPVVPVDPNAPPTTPVDPNAPALTTGGTIPALRHGRKRRHGRGAMADSLPGASQGPVVQTPSSTSSGDGEDAPPTDPGTGDDGTSTGGTTPLTP
jgi:hypothetical protein